MYGSNGTISSLLVGLIVATFNFLSSNSFESLSTKTTLNFSVSLIFLISRLILIFELSATNEKYSISVLSIIASTGIWL